MPPMFVAEVSSNHNRNLDRCLAFVDAAAKVGCQAVKFQLFRLDQLFAPEIIHRSESHRARKAWELPLDFLAPISDRCRTRKILFGCSPFYLNAVTDLLPYVDFYKISSYELPWQDLLAACARTHKPVVISTGMASLPEVKAAVDCLARCGCRSITVLHCVSGYPAPLERCNLSAIETLRKAMHKSGIQIDFGWSDHSRSPAVITRAVLYWNAAMVEFHMDLDETGFEYSIGHCWLPMQIEPVIHMIRKGIEADGDGRKIPSIIEHGEREWRADPVDGLRPMQALRGEYKGDG